MYVYVHVDVFFHIPPQVISPVAAIPKPGSHASVQRTVGATRIYQATVDQRLFINCINPRTLGYTRILVGYTQFHLFNVSGSSLLIYHSFWSLRQPSEFMQCPGLALLHGLMSAVKHCKAMGQPRWLSRWYFSLP